MQSYNFIYNILHELKKDKRSKFSEILRYEIFKIIAPEIRKNGYNNSILTLTNSPFSTAVSIPFTGLRFLDKSII